MGGPTKNGSETWGKGGKQEGKVKVPDKSQKGLDKGDVMKKGTVKPSGGIKE